MAGQQKPLFLRLAPLAVPITAILAIAGGALLGALVVLVWSPSVVQRVYQTEQPLYAPVIVQIGEATRAALADEAKRHVEQARKEKQAAAKAAGKDPFGGMDRALDQTIDAFVPQGDFWGSIFHKWSYVAGLAVWRLIYAGIMVVLVAPLFIYAWHIGRAGALEALHSADVASNQDQEFRYWCWVASIGLIGLVAVLPMGRGVILMPIIVLLQLAFLGRYRAALGAKT